ncbi:hypothetical protein ABZV31_33585 [Streptomyces sp. NPDC005202]|uniref:hypothetical protein n=1 Tax=Streptomyces sp. NPDC005202 TaxID=3157021 RepID=UPI0033A26A43
MSIADIRGALTSLAESRPTSEVMEAARERLGDEALDCRSVIAELGDLSTPLWQNLLCRSVDTTTHLKLSLDLNAHRGFGCGCTSTSLGPPVRGVLRRPSMTTGIPLSADCCPGPTMNSDGLSNTTLWSAQKSGTTSPAS